MTTGDQCIHGPGVNDCGHPDCVGIRGWRQAIRDGAPHARYSIAYVTDLRAERDEWVRIAAAHEADRDRLASLLEKLRPYLRHADDCPQGCPWLTTGCPYDHGDHHCRCSLADLLAEMPKDGDNP